MVTRYSMLHLPAFPAKDHGAIHTKPICLASFMVPDYPKAQELRHFNVSLISVFAFFECVYGN